MKALSKALAAYRWGVRMRQRLRRSDEEEVSSRRIVNGDTWDEFCDTLKAAGAAVSGLGAPQDAFTQAEGYRYLTRLLRAGLEAFVEYDDPQSPVLRRTVHETIKMGADNPDNHYYNATISGDHDYRLFGHRGTVQFLTFSTQKGGYGEGAGLPPTGFLDSRDLRLGDDGSFEIFVSVRQREGNWLPMDPDTGLLIVRQTFLDRKSEVPAELHIERLGDSGAGKPTLLSPARVDRGLKKASQLVAGASLLFAKWAKDFQTHTNELPLFDPEKSTAAGGDPNIAYYHSYWALAPEQALVIEATPPECLNWNFQLNNHWMESLDYRYATIHVNKHTATYEPDGSVRVVIAHGDPGLPNWVDTTGHRYGTMCWRWIHARSRPQPRTRVVALEDLRRELRS